MKIYCVKCRKDTENIDAKMVRTKNNRLMMPEKCAACGIKTARFYLQCLCSVHKKTKKELES